MHLEQMMQPGFPPPPPFKRFMRKAMVNKASQMLIQLQVGACSSSCFRHTITVPVREIRAGDAPIPGGKDTKVHCKCSHCGLSHLI